MDIKLGVTPGAKLEATLGAKKYSKQGTILDARWDDTLDIKLDVILDARWDATLDTKLDVILDTNMGEKLGTPLGATLGATLGSNIDVKKTSTGMQH